MKINIFKNITIKQANILTIVAIFFVSLIFVGLLVDEMYKDYKVALNQSLIYSKTDVVDAKKIEEDRLKSILIKTILVVTTLSFIIFAIALGFYKILGILLQDDTEAFLEFFQEASNGEKSISLDMIVFQDFKLLACYANKMVDTINIQKQELQELNQDLENRVNQKTQKLLEINEHLKQQQKLKEDILASQKEFLRYTVHETNTPLSVILASIELYTIQHPKDRQLQKIEVATKNIFSIYDDLSYLVKKDQIQYQKTILNFSEYLKYRVDFFADVAVMSKVVFEFNLKSQDLHIYFNETKLQRIVDNTITNAIKYTLADEIIDINLKQVGSNIEFFVASKSKTIQDIDKVFDGFYREEKNGDGFGLGLQMVKNICDEEGVKIEVSSDENKTIFTYLFKMMGD